jgi:hypothetical protein
MSKRPAHVKPPAHLSPNTPVPEPRAVARDPDVPAFVNREGVDPVRYGDWESKGIAIDF